MNAIASEPNGAVETYEFDPVNGYRQFWGREWDLELHFEDGIKDRVHVYISGVQFPDGRTERYVALREPMNPMTVADLGRLAELLREVHSHAALMDTLDAMAIQ
ncbi:hypothetical protein ACWDTP_17280 [Mycobacterium sp. NPDC003449]